MAVGLKNHLPLGDLGLQTALGVRLDCAPANDGGLHGCDEATWLTTDGVAKWLQNSILMSSRILPMILMYDP